MRARVRVRSRVGVTVRARVRVWAGKNEKCRILIGCPAGVFYFKNASGQPVSRTIMAN